MSSLLGVIGAFFAVAGVLLLGALVGCALVLLVFRALKAAFRR